jgi:hypothetical protein
LFLLDEVKEAPVQIPLVKPDPEKPNPKMGVGHVSFSNDCRFMATKNGMFCILFCQDYDYDN